MYYVWDSLLILTYLTDEEIAFVKKIVKKGEEGTATEEEIKKTNELIRKNNSNYNGIKKLNPKELQRLIEEEEKKSAKEMREKIREKLK